jgi:hypothetical protein
MGFGNKLKAVLLLDTGKFKRSAKDAKRDIKGVGEQAKKTSISGTAGFTAMAGSVTAIGAAALLAIKRIDSISVAIAKVTADAAKLSQDRFGAAAGAVNTPGIQAAQDVTTGQGGLAIAREALLRADRFALQSSAGAVAVKTAGGIGFGSEITAGRTAGEELALTFQGATGASGEATARLLKLSTLTLGLTPGQRESFFSGVAGAAEISGIDPGGFAAGFAVAGGIATTNKVPLGQVAGLFNALSLSKEAPEKIGTDALRVLGIALKVTPAIKKFIAEGGGDPEEKNPLKIADALRNFMSLHPDNARKLTQEGPLDRELVQSLQQTGTPEAKEAAAAGEAAFKNTPRSFLENKLAGKKRELVTKQRGAAFRRQAGDLVGLVPGSLGEAGFILEQIGAGFAGDNTAERQNRLLEFGVKVNEGQVGVFSDDPEFNKTARDKLFELEEAYPDIVATLRGLENAGDGESQTAITAKVMREDLADARKEALTPRKIVGNQLAQLTAYETAMLRAIQFIRQVELGSVSDTDRFLVNVPDVGGANQEIRKKVAGPFTPSAVERNTAGNANVGGTDITEAAGGIRTNILIQHNNGKFLQDATNVKADTKKP